MDRGIRRKGQGLVEFALILPVLIILLMGVVDLGRTYYVYVAITDAAREGVAYGAPHASSVLNDPAGWEALTDEIKERASRATEGLVTVQEDQVTVTVSESHDALTVTVTHSVELITPLIRNMVSGGVLPLVAVAVQSI